MSDVVINVENVSKLYRLGKIGTGTFTHDLNRWWHLVRGKEDPYLKIGEVNDRSKKGSSDYVWALRNISFEIKQGEVVGIIGKNGAGKSTLLKILSRTTTPTAGSIKIKGRVASLLEVGTGFHPELTGRENIFLNGAILGMRKWEIKKKFDEIVAFSGVEKYIDTPVKRYSSGMYVRLAFAVAAHLEPEILIVDEVLAVGDAEFQKKAVGKMKDVSMGEGRTVLFVSHNLSAVRQLCSKGLVLSNGQVVFNGYAQEAIDFYLKSNKKEDLSATFKKAEIENKEVELIRAEVLSDQLQIKGQFEINEQIILSLCVNCKTPIPGLYGYVAIKNSQEELLIESDTFDYMPNCIENLKIGENFYHLKINANVLAIGQYTVYLSFASTFANNFIVDAPADILKFSVVDNVTQRANRRTSRTAQLLKWEIKNA